jgi:hypothetical protein
VIGYLLGDVTERSILLLHVNAVSGEWLTFIITEQIHLVAVAQKVDTQDAGSISMRIALCKGFEIFFVRYAASTGCHREVLSNND